MDLWKVKAGERMRIPRQIDVMDRTWLGEGQVIDRGAPYMHALTEGQAYKLEPVDKADKNQSPAPLPRAIVYHIKGLEERDARKPKKSEVAAQAAVQRANEAGLSSGIPKPDKRPAKSKVESEAGVPAGFAE